MQVVILSCNVPDFIPRDAMHSADYAVETCLSVGPSICLSVRLSVIRRYSVEIAQRIILIFSPSGSHATR